MSRRQRLHVPGGTYYVVQRGNAHQPIFSRLEDYALFERLLATALRRTSARVHAYCWTPQDIHMIVQIEEISVGRLMQGLTSRYARSMHKRDGECGHFFRQRYKAVLIDAPAYLLKLMSHIHRAAVRAGLSESVGAYPFSSHRAYLRSTTVPWLTMNTASRLLDSCDQTSDYADLMAQELSQEDVRMFDRVGSNDLRVIGGTEFQASLPRHSRVYRTRTSLEQVIQTVTSTLGLERDHVLSSSRQRDFTLARALIAWYATERGIATLSEVARRLRRDPSTLSMAITRYRASRPELFKLTALHDVVPLAQVGSRPLIHGWDNATGRSSDDGEREIATG
jgi:putative transposase